MYLLIILGIVFLIVVIGIVLLIVYFGSPSGNAIHDKTEEEQEVLKEEVPNEEVPKDITNEFQVVYFNHKKNVGDLVGPWLYSKITGKVSQKGASRLAIVGSVCSTIKNAHHWGTGNMFANHKGSETNTIHALRGPLTSLTCEKDVPCGDPALLCPLYYNPSNQTKKHKLGVIPHYVDFEDVSNVASNDIYIINPQQDVESFIQEICSCEMTISSTLHGLILCIAYGIPTKWVQWSKRIAGGNFKYYDFFTSLYECTNQELRDVIEVVKSDPWKNGLPERLSDHEAWKIRDFKIPNIDEIVQKVFVHHIPSDLCEDLLSVCPFSEPEPICLKIQNSNLDRCKSCITPQFSNYMKYITGEDDIEFLTAQNRNQYIKDTYGSNAYLKVLIFFKHMPTQKVCSSIRENFPKITLVLFTNDIHKSGEPTGIKLCDKIISMTTSYQFKTLKGIDISDKLIHVGNRCPDEFLRGSINKSAKKAIFYYGAKYSIRKEFLESQHHNWDIIEHSFPKEKYAKNTRHLTLETSKQLYNYSYAFATGYDFTGSSQKCDQYYLVAKIFEIMGSGVLLLCDDRGIRHELQSLGFLEGKHYLRINNENAEDIRQFIDDNPEEVMNIRKRGHQLVKQAYTIARACQSINEKLQI